MAAAIQSCHRLHASARFQVVGPIAGKPVFFDDASYYLPFQRETEARLDAEILSSAPCRCFLATLMFPNAKRSLTVELLQRLNLGAIAEDAGLSARWRELRIEGYTAVEHHQQSLLIMETPLMSGDTAQVRAQSSIGTAAPVTPANDHAPRLHPGTSARNRAPRKRG